MSKRRVSPEDVAKCEDRYNKAKAVHSVLRHVADLRGLVLEDLSIKVSWPLYKKYGHAFDAFKLTLQDEEDVFVGLDIDEDTKQVSFTKSLNSHVPVSWIRLHSCMMHHTLCPRAYVLGTVINTSTPNFAPVMVFPAISHHVSRAE